MKRDREEDDEAQGAANELAGSLDRALPHLKLRALDGVSALLSCADELYSVHRALVEADAAFYLVQLVGDDSPAVSVKAAETICQLSSHSAAAVARLAAGPLKGLEGTADKVLLNPVQQELLDQGAVAALVPLALSGDQERAEAATLALGALCSYNHEGKLAYLEQLVAALQAGRMQALGHLEILVGAMKCGGEEAGRLLEELKEPLMRALRAPAPARSRVDGLALLGALLENCPAMAGSFAEAGAAPVLAGIIIAGSVEEQDLAVHGLWLVSRGDRTLLGADRGSLACDVVRLAHSLVRLVETSEEEEREAAQEEERAGYDPDSEADEHLGTGGGPGPPRLDICYADEASKLLRELAAHHEGVAQLLAGSVALPARKTSCCIM